MAFRGPILSPYIYDPESDPEAETPEETLTLRLQQDVSEWCSCGHCERMPTEAENVCCLEIPQVRSRLQEINDGLLMTQHPEFQPVSLNVHTLQMAGDILRDEYGPSRLKGIYRRCRYLAYRTFVGWC